MLRNIFNAYTHTASSVWILTKSWILDTSYISAYLFLFWWKARHLPGQMWGTSKTGQVAIVPILDSELLPLELLFNELPNSLTHFSHSTVKNSETYPESKPQHPLRIDIMMPKSISHIFHCCLLVVSWWIILLASRHPWRSRWKYSVCYLLVNWFLALTVVLPDSWKVNKLMI